MSYLRFQIRYLFLHAPLVALLVVIPATVRLELVRTELASSLRLFTLNTFVSTFCTRPLRFPALSCQLSVSLSHGPFSLRS